jgi:hypothetical protein
MNTPINRVSETEASLGGNNLPSQVGVWHFLEKYSFFFISFVNFVCLERTKAHL